MPVEINIGPPLLTINHGSTFMVTDLNGEIAADSEQGVFARDTRFVVLSQTLIPCRERVS
jgi:N-terminal domain of (some) glycogen debranching enzymes